MKKTTGELRQKINGFDVAIVVILLLFACFAAYPFLYTLAGAFNDGLDFEYGGIWLLPRKFSLANFAAVFGDDRLYRSLLNTVIVTVVGTFAALLFTSCVAYAMSHPRLRAKKVFWTINLITMFFSGGMVPYYLMINFVGLYDSFFVYIIPFLYSVYNMIVLTGFFKSIDPGMRESAMIDGASEFRILFSLYLPVSKPALATVGLWIAVARWNSYMPTLIYTNRDESMWLLQFYLMRIIKDSQLPDDAAAEVTQRTVSFAAIVVATIPIFCVYPFIAKYFTKGIMLGAIKG